jgi:hypothetical protein
VIREDRRMKHQRDAGTITYARTLRGLFAQQQRARARGDEGLAAASRWVMQHAIDRRAFYLARRAQLRAQMMARVAELWPSREPLPAV